MQNQGKTTTLPGVIAALAAGFDLTARHLWLIIPPVLLDIFFWLGPRLSFQQLIEQMLAFWVQQPELAEMGEFAQLSQLLGEIAPHTNLFTMLAVPVIGVPTLMAGVAFDAVPVTPVVEQVGSWGTWIGLFLLFLTLGLLITAVYYTLIAYAIHKQAGEDVFHGLNAWGQRVGKSWLRLVGLSLIFFVNIIIIYLPLMILATILFLISPTLGTLVLLAGPFIVLWILIFMCMAPQGIVLNGRPTMRAIVESFRLVQTFLLPTLLILSSIILAGAILDWLLLLVENGAWFSLINIIGHAFVSTALIAALFVFYRDRYQALFEKNTLGIN